MKIKKNYLLVLLGTLIILIIACGLWLVSSPCHEQYTQVVSAPGYIGAVSPPPGSEITFGCYSKKNLQNIFHLFSPIMDLQNSQGRVEDGGVNVKIQVTGHLLNLEILQSDSKKSTPFKERVTLYVDGKNAVKTIYWEEQSAPLSPIGVDLELASAYIFGSNLFLLPGDHIAKVVILTESGETLEYEWHFKIR